MGSTTRDVWKLRYQQHKANAKKRGIPFRLTFNDWCSIWRRSGRWNRRGAARGQYVMARPRDQGAYEVGNVMICLAQHNRAERNRLNPMKGEHNPAFGKDYWAGLSDKVRKRRKREVSAQFKDKRRSKATRAAMSATATGRRATMRDGRKTWTYPGDADYSIATGWGE